MGGLRGLVRTVAFVKIIILARILTPEEFGIFGISLLLLSLLEIISETGVNIFLIQENKDTDIYINTAWVVSIFRGIFIFFAILIVSPVISKFFDSPGALRIIRLISLVPLIRGFVNPSVVRFQKNLLFSKEFLFRLFVYLVDATVAIFFAFINHSAVSIVYGLIAGAFFEVIISQLFIIPRPKFIFNKNKIKQIVNRGKWVTFAGVFNYLFENFDDAVVGKLLNTTQLGIYQVAYKISSLPMTEVSDVIQKVTFPVYTKIVKDKKRVKSAFIKSLLATSAVVLPIGIILFLFSENIINIFLGPNWISAAFVIKILSFFGVVRALTETTYPLFLAFKKQKYITVITLFSIIGLLITIFPMVKNLQIAGAGFSSLTGALFAIPVTMYYLNKVFK